MAATTTNRNTTFGPLVPARGDVLIGASTTILRHTLVAQNASGHGVAPTDGDGLPIVGFADATYDNRAGTELGGAAGGASGEERVGLIYGTGVVFYTGAAPRRGQRLYSVDNQTVSVSSNGGLRGPAGYAAADGASGSVELNVGPAALLGKIAGHDTGVIDVPLGSLRLSTGAAIAAFASGSADGFALVDSEAFGLRINDDSTTTFVGSVPLPADLDEAAAIVVKFRGFRVGASDVTAALTVGAFFQTLGAAHTADANAGGTTTAFDGATTIVTEESLTIAAADVPPAPASLTLTFTATAALDDDDLVVTGISLEYTRKAG